MNINLTNILYFISMFKSTIRNIKPGPYLHIPPILKNYDQFVKENYNSSTIL